MRSVSEDVRHRVRFPPPIADIPRVRFSASTGGLTSPPESRRSYRPLWGVGSTGDGNTLTFLRRWSVGHEAAASHLLLGGPTG